MANQSRLNGTEVDPDDGERERKLEEVESMLMEMRNRSSSTQRKIADREKKEAEKRNVDSHIVLISALRVVLGWFMISSSFSTGAGPQASKRSAAGER